MHNLRNIRKVELTGISGQLLVAQNRENIINFPCSLFEYLGVWQGYLLR